MKHTPLLLTRRADHPRRSRLEWALDLGLMAGLLIVFG